eukprot:11646831-Prorocentrum_lima.AAC.1
MLATRLAATAGAHSDHEIHGAAIDRLDTPQELCMCAPCKSCIRMNLAAAWEKSAFTAQARAAPSGGLM